VACPTPVVSNEIECFGVVAVGTNTQKGAAYPICAVFFDTGSRAKPFENCVPMAHTCNPSYSRGRDQEDRCSKPA
jgi:hypothetical protein